MEIVWCVMILAFTDQLSCSICVHFSENSPVGSDTETTAVIRKNSASSLVVPAKCGQPTSAAGSQISTNNLQTVVSTEVNSLPEIADGALKSLENKLKEHR